MNVYFELLLSVLLIAVALSLTRVTDLFSVVVLLSVYSGLLAVEFAVLGAVDVSFTEAVVGTGVSTVFLMALLRRVDPRELTYRPRPQRLLALVVSLALGGLLLRGVHALPEFGAADSPAATHVSPRYIERSIEEMETPNVVTAVLADYRSFDTLIETTVVFTAALACFLILREEKR